MTAVTGNDLSRLEDLIISGQKTIETQLTTMETRLTTMETRLTTMETRLTGIVDSQVEIKADLKALEIGQTEIKDDLKVLEIGQSEIKGEIKVLDAKIGGINERIKSIETAIVKIPDLAEKVGELKNWRQIVIIALTAVISSAVTWVIRGGNLKP